MKNQQVKNFSLLYLGVVFLLLVPQLTFANTDKKTSEKSPEPVLVYGVEQCESVVAAYIDWHGKASAIGTSLEQEELEWFKSQGYVVGKTPSLRNPTAKASLDELYEQSIEPEQRIVKFIELSVMCVENSETPTKSGNIAVKVELESGDTTVLYHGIGSKTSVMYGTKVPKSFSSITETLNQFEEFPDELIRRLEAVRVDGAEDVKRQEGIRPNNLIFNDDQVEFWFAWPSDTLIKSREVVETEYSSLNGTPHFFVSEHEYETLISNAQDGVRVSELADNRAYRFKASPDSDWMSLDQTEAADCLIDSKAYYCWRRLSASVAPHFEYSSSGEPREISVDSLYVNEVEQWMQEQLGGAGNTEQSNEELAAWLEEGLQAFYSPGANARVNFYFRGLNLKIMTKGEADTPALDGSLGKFFYPQPSKPYTSYPLIEARYVGRVPCNSLDKKNRCAKIEYRNKPLSTEEQGFSEYVVKNDILVDFVIEPHTLLVHEFHYLLSGESRSYLNSESADEFAKIKVSIYNTFETVQ